MKSRPLLARYTCGIAGKIGGSTYDDSNNPEDGHDTSSAPSEQINGIRRIKFDTVARPYSGDEVRHPLWTTLSEREAPVLDLKLRSEITESNTKGGTRREVRIL